VSLRRAVSAVVGLIAAAVLIVTAVLLTSCDKPQPTVTVLGNDHSVQLTA